MKAPREGDRTETASIASLVATALVTACAHPTDDPTLVFVEVTDLALDRLQYASPSP